MLSENCGNNGFSLYMSHFWINYYCGAHCTIVEILLYSMQIDKELASGEYFMKEKERRREKEEKSKPSEVC